MKDKTLILGAAGFIGTNLTLRLLDGQSKIILFDKKGIEYPAIIREHAKVQKATFTEGSFAEMSSADWQEVIPSLDEVQTVYHLISTTCPTNSNLNVAVELEDNLLATIRFLDACVAAKVPRVVFLSSGGTVYGKEHTGLCKEEEEACPITAYGMQKLSIEKALYLYQHMYGLDYRIIRLANPYGPYQRPNGLQGAVSTFTWRALHDEPIVIYGDGSVIRDYIYIDDAIEGIVQIANSEGKHRLYNLGSGKGYSLLEVVDRIAQNLKKRPEIVFQESRKVDVPVNVLDISRFEQDFQKLNPIGLADGIGRLALFYKEFGNCNEKR